MNDKYIFYKYIIMAFPKKLNDLCSPALLYFVVSMIGLIMVIYQNLGNRNKYDLFSSLTIVNISTNYDSYKLRNKKIIESFNSIENPNLYKIYPDKSFCSTSLNRCVANDNKHLFYFDDNHLSLEGSKYVVKDIMKAIQQIEVDKKTNK